MTKELRRELNASIMNENLYSSCILQTNAQPDLNVRVIQTQILCNSNDGQKRLETFFPKFSFQKHKTISKKTMNNLEEQTRKYNQQRCYRLWKQK